MASPAAIADDNVQPVPCVFSVFTRLRAKPQYGALPDQQIDTFLATAVTTFNQDIARPKCQKFSRL